MKFRVVFALALIFGFAADLRGQNPVTASQVTTPIVNLPPSDGVAQVTQFFGSAAVYGTTPYYYWFVSRTASNVSPPAGPLVVQAPASLSSLNNISINWTPIAGIASYDVLRTATSATPTGACNCAVALATALTTLTDSGAALQSYTVATVGYPWAVTSQIFNGVQSIVGNYQGQIYPIAPLNAAGATYAAAFGAKFDGKACWGSVDTIVVTATSNVVTCNHANFSQADVGKQFTWTNGCCGVGQNYGGILLGPNTPTTITAVNSATSITVSQNATTSCTGSSCIIAWASNDDAALSAAETQWASSNKCQALILPAGITAILQAHFNNPGNECLLGSEPQADYTAEVVGQGKGSTIVGLFAGFNGATCTGGGSANACFGGYKESVFQNFQFNGFGWGNTGFASAKHLLGPGLGSEWLFMGCLAFGGSDTNLTGFGYDGAGVRVWSLTIDGCGAQGGLVGGIECKAYYSFFGDTLNANLVIQPSDDLEDFGSDYGVAGNTIVINNGGTYRAFGADIFSCGPSSGTTAIYVGNQAASTYLDGSNFNCGSPSSNGYYADTAGANLRVVNSVLGGTSTAVLNTLGTVYSQGGNTFTSASKALNNGGTFIDGGVSTFVGSITNTGNIFGSASITGTALVATNVTPSTGWGTSGAAGNGVSAPSGDSRNMTFTITAAGTPSANPTTSIMFPTSFLTAPICAIGTNTGTGVVADSVPGTPTTTSLSFTWQGTPVAGSTYIFVVRCQ